MESFAADLKTMVRTPLEETHVEAMCQVGTVSRKQPGEIVQEPGAATAEFHYVLSSELEGFDPRTG